MLSYFLPPMRRGTTARDEALSQRVVAHQFANFDADVASVCAYASANSVSISGAKPARAVIAQLSISGNSLA
jgi:hypothetical protein